MKAHVPSSTTASRSMFRCWFYMAHKCQRDSELWPAILNEKYWWIAIRAVRVDVSRGNLRFLCLNTAVWCVRSEKRWVFSFNNGRQYGLYLFACPLAERIWSFTLICTDGFRFSSLTLILLPNLKIRHVTLTFSAIPHFYVPIESPN